MSLSLRSTKIEDAGLAALDPDHQAAPEFWLKQGGGVETFVIESAGEPILFVRVENIRRLHVNFIPHQSALARSKALLFGLKQVMEKSRICCTELIFKSVSPKLIQFMSKLGFTRRTDDFGVNL